MIKLSSEHNEKLIIGAMLHNNGQHINNIISDGVDVDLFHHQSSIILFQKILLFHNEERLSSEALLDELISTGQMNNTLTGVIPIDVWLDVNKLYLNSQQIKPCIKQLRLYFVARQLYATIEIGQQKLNDNEGIEDTLTYMSQNVEECFKSLDVDSDITASKQAAENFISFIEDSAVNRAKYVTETGIPAVDAIAGGMRGGEVWIVAGYPSGGKSAVSLQVVTHLMRVEIKSMIFNLEMDDNSIMCRLCCCYENLELGKILNVNTCSKGDLQRIKDFTIKVKETEPFHICDDASLTIDQICAKAEKQFEKTPFKFLVVDYIQLVSGGKQDTREQEVAKISRNLKKLAKKLGITVMALSQLNKDGAMRESTAIANDADVILKITENGIAVAKYRNAPRGQMLPLFLNGALQKFHQIA